MIGVPNRFQPPPAYMTPAPAVWSASPWGAAAFVWGVWAAAVLGGLAFVVWSGVALPAGSDWQLVPYQAGGKSLEETARFVWARHWADRRPLPAALQIALGRLTGVDNRVPAVFTVLALGFLALALVEAAAHVRGGNVYADAFFPVALLSWVVSDVLFRAGALAYTVPTVLAGAVLAVVVRRGTRVERASAIGAGVCLVLLALCGLPGLVYLPVLAGWLAYAGVRAWRSERPRGKSAACLAWSLTLAALLTAAAWFTGYEAGPVPTAAADVAEVGDASLGFLAAGLGRSANALWPYSGYAALLLVAAGAVVLTEAALTSMGRDRSRALGMLAFLAALMALTLAVGATQGRLGAEGGVSLYVLPAPVLCWVYLVWVVYRPATVGHMVQTGLLLGLCLLTSLNVEAGLSAVRARAAAVAALEQDVREGVPPYALVARHRAVLGTSTDDGELADALILLRQTRAPSFRKLRDNPPFEELALAREPVEVHQAVWKAGSVRGTGAGAYLTFALPRPAYVAGIRFRAAPPDGPGGAWQLAWRRGGQASFPEKPQATIRTREASATAFVADTIDQVRIYPDPRAGEVRVVEFTLLLPVVPKPDADDS